MLRRTFVAALGCGAGGMIVWSRARADSLRLSLPKPGGAPALPANAGSSNGLPLTPLQARTMASRAVSSSVSIADESALTAKRLNSADAALDQGRQKLEALIKKKYEILDEFRRGLYCSLCKKTKAQLEAEGINFLDHIRQVGAQVLQVSQQEINIKEQELDVPIDAERREQYKRQEDRDKLARFNAALLQQFPEGVALWRTAIMAQSALMLAQRQQEAASDEKELAAAQEAVHRLELEEQRLTHTPRARNELSPRVEDDLQNIEIGKRTWQAVAGQMRARMVARQQQYLQDVDEATRLRDQDFQTLLKAAGEITGSDKYKLASLPSLKLTIADWTVETDPERLGVRFHFGKVLEAGVEVAFNGNSYSSEARAFVDAFGLVKVYVGNKTEIGFNGTQTTQVQGIEFKGGDEEKHSIKPQITIKPPKPSESWKVRLPRP